MSMDIDSSRNQRCNVHDYRSTRANEIITYLYDLDPNVNTIFIIIIRVSKHLGFVNVYLNLD